MDRPRREAVDRVMVASSRAADYSVLWLAMAAALAVAGGERGRRAARCGLVALAGTSALVNGPVKRLFDRPRPARRHGGVRALRSSSFPSGHAATAFAFTSAATRELPVAAPLLAPLAVLVAVSRVYLGAHHASDVVVGAAVGAAMGLRLGELGR